MKTISVCLLSGGLDSCVATAITKEDNNDLYLLSIDWGQTLVRELENAKILSDIFQPVEHKFLDLRSYNPLSKSALTAHQEIPKNRTLEKNISEIPVTYPPGRDPTFIMIASSWLESIMLDYLRTGESVVGKVIIGTNKQDSLVYPDCSLEVYKTLNSLFEISTEVGKKYEASLQVETPLIKFDKKRVLQKGLELGAPIEHTRSCYRGADKLCGKCDPCRIIYYAFEDLGVGNPFEYQNIPARRY